MPLFILPEPIFWNLLLIFLIFIFNDINNQRRPLISIEKKPSYEYNRVNYNKTV